MSLRNLLKGQEAGAPLFLAWSVGTFVAFVFSFVLVHLGRNDPPYVLAWIGFLGGLLILGAWQSLLLTPDWRRRGLWVTFYLITPVCAVRHESVFWLYWAVQVGCGILLLGARRRVWAWMLAATLLNPDISQIGRPAEELYSFVASKIADFGVGAWLLPFIVPYAFSVQIAFGILAAFFMPPVKKD